MSLDTNRRGEDRPKRTRQHDRGGDASTSQEMSPEGQRMDSPLVPPEQVRLQFGPLASRTGRRYIAIVLSHPLMVTCPSSHRKLAQQVGLDTELLPSRRSRTGSLHRPLVQAGGASYWLHLQGSDSRCILVSTAQHPFFPPSVLLWDILSPPWCGSVNQVLCGPPLQEESM